MKAARRWLLLGAILPALGATGCGSSSAPPAGTRSPAVIATRTARTTTHQGTLPFTQPSKADARFATHLGARCRAIRSSLTRHVRPTTLSGQASFSELEKQQLTRLRTAIAAIKPPADLAHALRPYLRALLTAIRSDGFVVDAAKSQQAEGVAYWLSRRAAAIEAMKHSSAALGAPAC